MFLVALFCDTADAYHQSGNFSSTRLVLFFFKTNFRAVINLWLISFFWRFSSNSITATSFSLFHSLLTRKLHKTLKDVHTKVGKAKRAPSIGTSSFFLLVSSTLFSSTTSRLGTHASEPDFQAPCRPLSLHIFCFSLWPFKMNILDDKLKFF